MDNEVARAMFDDNAADLQNVRIIGGSLERDHLVLQLDSNTDGRFALEFHAVAIVGDDMCKLEIDFDEPAGAGADPYGRPDPTTHPEAWSE